MKAKSVYKQPHKKLKVSNFKALYELDQQKLEIAKRIIAYRIKNKLRGKQLADKAGVTPQYISKIESGEFFSIEVLQKILFCIGFKLRIQAVPLNRALRNIPSSKGQR